MPLTGRCSAPPWRLGVRPFTVMESALSLAPFRDPDDLENRGQVLRAASLGLEASVYVRRLRFAISVGMLRKRWAARSLRPGGPGVWLPGAV